MPAMSPLSNRRVLRLFILIFIILALGLYFLNKKFLDYLPKFQIRKPEPVGSVKMTGGSLPGPGPGYERFILAEQALPQHDLSEGMTRKYVKFSNQIRALGWNNVLNEVLLNSHLAWKANRSYVFQDYYWKPDYYPWDVPEWPWPQNPLTTLIAGPTVGGPWDEGDSAPLSVREDFWDQVCPPEDTEIIDSDVGKAPVFWSDGQTIMNHWAKLLQESPKRCVDVVHSLSGKDGFSQTFDLWLIGTTRLLTVWPELKKSPVSRLLATSPLVQTAVDQNELKFFPKGPRPPFGYNPYEHMMAIHIRRGDYLQACKGLADWNSTFYGWNLLPELPDPFTAPPNEFEGGNAPPNHVEFYLKRCLPTNDYILDKVEDSRRAWERNGPNRRLDVLFIMTNAKKEWVEEFKRSLAKRNAEWNVVVTTKELELDFEQTGVNMAVDMELGRKAAVYIGMGWSSMTSNILHRRLVDGKEPLANRFW